MSERDILDDIEKYIFSTVPNSNKNFASHDDLLAMPLRDDNLNFSEFLVDNESAFLTNETENGKFEKETDSYFNLKENIHLSYLQEPEPWPEIATRLSPETISSKSFTDGNQCLSSDGLEISSLPPGSLKTSNPSCSVPQSQNGPSTSLILQSKRSLLNPDSPYDIAPSKRPGNEIAEKLAALVRKRRATEGVSAAKPFVPSGNFPPPGFSPSLVSIPLAPRFSLAKEAVLRSLGVQILENGPSWQTYERRQLSTLSSLPPQVLRSAVVALAEAMAMDDQGRASALEALIEAEASHNGPPVERVAVQYLRALRGRRENSLMDEYVKGVVITNQEEGPLWEFVCGLPCLRFWMEGIAGAILDAVQGFRKVHIVDLGAWSGQWPYLIRQLAERPGGPPEEVRFTSVVAPAGDPMGLGPVDRSEAFDGPLRRAAQECSLRLSISRVECPLAHLSFSSFREQGEVGKEGEEEALVINCALRLSQLPDSSVLRCSPRDWVLRQLAEAQPVLVTQAEMEADCNSPFFLERIRNTFDLFWKVFEAHAEFPGLTSLAREKGRELFESAVLGREIRNIIGCEGSLRVVRHQPSASWHSRMAKAGLIPKNIPNNLVKFLRSSANSRVAELDCLISKPGTAALTYGGEVIGTVLTWQPFTRALLAIQG